jgi:hypothetical protein
MAMATSSGKGDVDITSLSSSSFPIFHSTPEVVVRRDSIRGHNSFGSLLFLGLGAGVSMRIYKAETVIDVNKH